MRTLALTLALVACAFGCHRDRAAAQPVDDAGADTAPAPPDWLGDAGLLARAPVAQPLHALCGIASNPGDMPLGADATSSAMRKGYFDAALDLGGVMIRRDFRWPEIEPTAGTFAFDDYDRLLDDARQRGVRVLGTLGYGTLWANASAKDEYYPPSDPATFATYAKTTAARYAGRVVGWEIWNEPNNGWRFWKTNLNGEPAAYGALLAATYDAVHAADAKAQVMLGGTVFTPQLIEGAMDWLGEAYDAHPDLAKHFDLMGAHAYMQYPPERAPEIGEDGDAPLEAKIQMHAWMLAQHGAADRPIWITELGWPVAGKVDEATQARFLVRATVIAAHAGASAIFWYTLRDGPHPEKFPPEDAFGLLRNDADFATGKEATPKPAYVALEAMLATIGERWATVDDPKLGPLPDDGHAVRFHGATGGDVIVAWTVTTASAQVVASRDVDVVDVLGVAKGTVNAGAPIALTPDPIYLVER